MDLPPKLIPVHPRVCGEHWPHLTDEDACTTVHPRVCGEHPIRMSEITWKPRFIPASAGNTYPFALIHHNRPVHPRVCGEHSMFS